MQGPQPWRAERRHYVGIQSIHAVVALASGRVHVVTNADVERQLPVGFPVILHKSAVLETLRAHVIGDLVLAPGARAADAGHESSQSVAAARIRILGRTGEIVVEVSTRGARLRVVRAVHPSLNAELQIMRALNPVQCSQKLVRLRTLPFVAPGLGSHIGAIRRSVVSQDDRGNKWDVGIVHVSGHPEGRDGRQAFVLRLRGNCFLENVRPR